MRPHGRPRKIIETSPPHVKIPLPWRAYQRRFLDDTSRLRLWVKSAQIGGSTAVAAWMIIRCLARPNHLCVVLSRSEPQSKEVLRKARRLVEEMGGVETTMQDGFFKSTEMLEHSLRFQNGSRIIALAGNADTARGYSGDMILDEFAFHGDWESIFEATFRQVTLGYSMLIVSTPNGQQGRFWQLAKGLGLDLGFRPPSQPVKNGAWSGHWTDIYMARDEGLPVSPEEIRQASDEYTFAQEFCCQFLSESQLWLSPQLIEANTDAQCQVGPPALHHLNLFAGWDVARSRDHSDVWFTQLVGDVSWTRGLVNITGMDTPTQLAQARAWMPQIARLYVDMSGMGLTLTEMLKRDYPNKVEGVQFTNAIKEQMAAYTKMRLEQRKLRLPNDDTVRRSFLSLRRSQTMTGNVRFDAAHDERYGHADAFWACALAEMAAQRGGIPSQESVMTIVSAPEARPIFANFMNKVL